MKRKRRIFFLICLSCTAIGFAICGVAFKIATQDLPSLDALKNYHPPQSSQVFDRNGQLIGSFFDERRTVIPVSTLPDFVKNAFIAAEDAEFYSHSGIDFMSLLRASALEVKYRILGGRRVGGSTITQQTARSMLLTTKQTYVRKFQELVLARRIEEALTKDEILHLYLNQIYFGNGAHGIEEAARTYFGKPAAQLRLFEAAVLASVPKSPNRINPMADLLRLKSRQEYVLTQMVKHGLIAEAAAKAALKTPIFSGAVEARRATVAPYFLAEVKKFLSQDPGLQSLSKDGLKVYSTLDLGQQKAAEAALTKGLRNIDRRYGYRGPLIRLTLPHDEAVGSALKSFKTRFLPNNSEFFWDLTSLSVEGIKKSPKDAVERVRLVPKKNGQSLGARVLLIRDTDYLVDLGSSQVSMPFSEMTWALKKNSKAKHDHGIKVSDIILVKVKSRPQGFYAELDQWPEINGALVSLDVETGGVLASVGGYDFVRSPFDRLFLSKRQLGSGLKPIIYGHAIDRNLVTAASMITDVPKVFFDPGTNDYWRPKNHTRRYLGDITLRHCLTSSINTCTITLLEGLGIDSFMQFAASVGLNRPETPYPRNLTIALGSADGIPIRMANAMRIFPSGGLYSDYHLVNKVSYPGGEVEFNQEKEQTRVLSTGSAYIISNILQGVVGAQKRELMAEVVADLAGKTGTTNDARSCWFIGFSQKVLSLVYVGYDDNRSIGANEWGNTAAYPIWADFMRQVPEHREPLAFSVPEDLDWRWVNQVTGEVRETSEGSQEHYVREAFLPGTAPRESNVINRTPLELLESSSFAP